MILFVITAHDEGDILRRTLAATVESLSDYPGRFSLLVLADSCDAKTESVISSLEVNAISLELGDVGAARNFAIDNLSIGYEGLVFLDGDDMVSDSWLKSLMNLKQYEESESLVCPSQRVLYWGPKVPFKIVFKQPDSTKLRSLAEFALRTSNLWASCVYIPSSVITRVRFPEKESGLLNEDWWFFLSALNSGLRVTTLQGELWYLQKTDSRRRQHARQSKSGNTAEPRTPGHKSPFRKIAALLLLLFLFDLRKSINLTSSLNK